MNEPNEPINEQPTPDLEPRSIELSALGGSMEIPITPEMAALFLRGIAHEPPRDFVAGCVERGRRQSDHLGVSRREAPCCAGPDEGRRDAILVVVPTPTQIAALHTAGNANHDRTILLVAVNDHHGRSVPVVLDVETLEQHVNRCCEAIAFVRQRNEAGS